jgi:hypothetical protein
MAGQPIGEIRIVVPAGWGPNRRTALRTAAHRAGLPAPTLLEAPVAVAEHLLATGAVIPPGAALLVCDYGADTETSLLRRTPTGFDILATMAATDAGGDQIDRDLAGQLIAWTRQIAATITPDSALHAQDTSVVAAARSGKESLSAGTAVTIPLPPPHPPIVLTAAHLDTVAAPVLARAAQLARATLDAVEDVGVEQLAGVYCVGGGAQLPAAGRLVGEHLGRPATVVANPQWAATLGAARATDTHSDAPVPIEEPQLPPIRRAFALAVPGFFSLALVVHAYTSAHLERRPGLYDPNAYVLANWGELAIASVFALLTCLTAATLIASVIPPDRPTGTGQPATVNTQVGTGLLVAIAMGFSIGGIYAIAGSVHFGLPNGPFLRWALIPQIPIAVAVVATAVLSTRLRRPPPGGWHAWLNFPVSSLICAAVGTFLVQYSMSAPRYEWDEKIINIVGRIGALSLGVAAGLLATRALYRIIIAAPLAVFAAAIVSWPATGMLATIYIVAVAMWWIQCIWKLVRRHAVRPPAAYTDIGYTSTVPRTGSTPQPTGVQPQP